MPPLPEPFFAGYMPKKVARKPEWLKNTGVEEICSVSDCISPAPPGWIDHWTHNDLGLYDTLAAAEAVVPQQERADYEVFAFRLYPVRFDDDGMVMEEELVSRVKAPDTLLEGWQFLGYDLAGRSTGSYFECSPLSCNHCAEQVAVNRHCLLEDRDVAIQKGIEFGNPESGVEPGPYYLLEVYYKPKADRISVPTNSTASSCTVVPSITD